MANFTKKAIKDTFIALLEEYPLSEITVKTLVEKCGINRNSFYYHYQDSLFSVAYIQNRGYRCQFADLRGG